MAEYTPQQRAAIAVLLLLTDGPQREADLALRLGYGEDAFGLLANISGVPQLRLYNDRGWWHLLDVDLSGLKDALRITDQALREADGGAYCRPMTRRDMARIRDALKAVEKMVATPETETAR